MNLLIALIADLIKKNEKHLARSFNLSFRYIDDVLSLTIHASGTTWITSSPKN